METSETSLSAPQSTTNVGSKKMHIRQSLTFDFAYEELVSSVNFPLSWKIHPTDPKVAFKTHFILKKTQSCHNLKWTPHGIETKINILKNHN